MIIRTLKRQAIYCAVASILALAVVGGLHIAGGNPARYETLAITASKPDPLAGEISAAQGKIDLPAPQN